MNVRISFNLVWFRLEQELTLRAFCLMPLGFSEQTTSNTISLK